MSLLARLRDKLPAAKPIVREGGTVRVDQSALRGSAELVRKAIAALPNTSALFPTRESYRDVGYAIKAALPDSPDDAFDIFAEWCGRWKDGTNDPDIVDADWRRMKPPFRRGASWLYELATQHGGGSFDRAEQWFVPPAEAPLFPPTEPEPSRKFTLVRLADAARQALTEQTPPLIKGFLDQGTMSVLYGDSNTGKTFVALDIGHHVATGRTWAGLRCTRMNVVYVAAEGGRGINKRAAALVAKFGDADDFYLVRESVDLFDANADLRPLIHDILAVGSVGLVVLDTLARVMAGGDENATKDMGVFVRNVDALRQAIGAHVMLIHHTGKDASRGARGSSALRAATDTEIEVSEDTIAVTKQRDLDKSLSFAFKLHIVELGKDSDGDPITSGTITVERDSVASTVGNDDTKARLTAVEASIYRALEKALTVTDQDCIAIGDLLDLAGASLSKLKPETVRTHLRTMAGKGFVTRAKVGAWTLATRRPAGYFEAPAVSIFD